MRKEQIFIPQYEPEDSLGGHLEFALKYEGLQLHLLVAIFEKVAESDLIAYIQSRQTGRYARRIWYLYEKTLNKKIATLSDLRMGNYVDLLDPEEYFVFKGIKNPRHRVEDNLFGTVHLAPPLRKTDKLKQFLSIDFTEKATALISQYPHELLVRAVHYLFTKETKSSFEIEKEFPDSKKSERFIQVLKNVDDKNYLEKKNLIDLQNEIVDARFIDKDYRKSQNYVGETLPNLRQKIHFISPQPEDVTFFMTALKDLFERGADSEVHPFALATAISFLFVFIHPFEDGNGRIHRFLLHDILRKMNFTPEGVIFPISATLLRHKDQYDWMLESISEDLVNKITYEVNEDGQMQVHGPTLKHYQYLDLTLILEKMFEILNETIEKDLADELAYLVRFDINREALKNIVDLPDKDLNLFIRLCLSNGGKLSTSKRKSHFAKLTDAEIEALEKVFQRQ